jgi:hypothetical protein
MLKAIFSLTAGLLLSVPLQAQNAGDWLQLFNGRNLDGWHVKIRGHALDDNFGDTFGVENGVLRVNYGSYEAFDERFGHIFYERPFSYYRIAVEYRFIGDQAAGGPSWARRNSGIMLHSPPPESMGEDQNFPISIEIQLLGGLGEGPRTTANLCTPGTNVVMDGRLVTRHCTQSTSKTYDGDQWVRVEAVVLGASLIRHEVEGETVLQYEMPQIGGGNVDGYDPKYKKDGELLDGGYISLQSESHPVEFRKVELLNLAGCMDTNSKAYRDYFVKSEPTACR